MGQINFTRVLLGTLIAGVLMFIGDGLLHGMVLKQSWTDAFAALGRKETGESGGGMIHFALYDLLKAFGAIWIYAAIRPRFSPGPRTALHAGVIAWALTLPIALIGTIPMKYYPVSHVVIWSVVGLVPMAIATVAGAAVYREE